MKERLIKTFNIIAIIYVVIGTFMLNFNESYALSDIIDNPDMWKPEIMTTSTSFWEKLEAILGVFNVVGVIVIVCTLSFIGMKFILGSVEGKAQYKQTLVPWLIGAVIVCLSVTTIPNIIFKLSDTNLPVRS